MGNIRARLRSINLQRNNANRASGVTAVNNLTGNGLGPDADCIGGGCTVIFD